MFCFWRTSDLAVLLIWGVFVAGSSCTDKNQTTQNNSSVPVSVVNTTVSVQMGSKALLCCYSTSLTKAVLITWIIKHRDLPSCTIAYKVETKTNETNCLGRNIIWAFTPDYGPELQISAVTLQHEGNYSCETVTPEGNFERNYDLQVLVPPEVTYFPGKNRTAVCEAMAGKPAAQISWTPDGDCVTKSESHSNGTVTVRSKCQWEQNNVSVVSCFVSHLTGNQSLSIKLSRGGDQLSPPYIPYIITSIIILIIIGCICLLKISGFRMKCSLMLAIQRRAIHSMIL
ncbi:cell surface glycoprotein CD200 receptor 1 isoform X2 [Mus caroli]|uniref:Cell surface glycoprotein CD200 receptor 1 isoform X2 n=1 Tax=Mus caroli TaxID=10089 RepID=A0A6P7QK92_MUSCR|nr:cell surface glycoprotein CD200 receptor 1 isoform X2 [Mus caroli]